MCGGDTDFEAAFSGGYYVSPAVVVTDNEDHSVVTDEVFGRNDRAKFSDEADVVNRANATRLGLAAAGLSQNFSLAISGQCLADRYCLDQRIQYSPEIPFGGYKESGIGRENGLQTIEHFTQTKTIYANLGKVEKIIEGREAPVPASERGLTL